MTAAGGIGPDKKAKRILLLGATGSIGRQTLEVAREFPGRFEVVGMSARKDMAGLVAAAKDFPDALLALSGIDAKAAAASELPHGRFGAEALLSMIRELEADIVVNGIAGAAGLAPSIAALESGKDLALANKESVVMGFALLESAARSSGKAILPVDSEHAAVFQLLKHHPDPEEIIITASGGAFRDRPLDSLGAAKPDEAAMHPSWNMGRKISIDSATMANKGLEVIEASRLFRLPAERIKVIVHPQSIVHALVRGRDGSLFANMSSPDMRLPILNALVHPEVLPSPFGRLDLGGVSLDFIAPDPHRYPLLGLAYEALFLGEGATVAYNAADEVAVAAFESLAIGYNGIAKVVETVLSRPWPQALPDLGSVFEVDRLARQTALDILKEMQ